MEGGEGGWEWERVCWSVGLVAIISVVFMVWHNLCLRPRRIRSVLQKQGILGPSPSFLSGNVSEMHRIQSQYSTRSSHSHSLSDQWFDSFFPYLQHWTKQYGTIYKYSTGTKQHVQVGDVEWIKELNVIRHLDLGKPSYLSKPLKPMLGAGIIRANGPLWSFQRNLIAPHFFLSKIQNMVDFIEESSREMMGKWERRIRESEGGVSEVVIDEDLKVVTADVISKACFGSSYAQGNQIFAKLSTMQSALSKPSLLFGFLNLRFFPTKENKELWKLKKEVDELILKIINERKLEKHRGRYEKDLLDAIVESSDGTNFGGSGGWGMLKRESKKLIVDMCKNIYFAGSETTALLATWTLILLAFHPEWLQRVRSEILDIYGNLSPHCFRDMDKFRKLKTLTMVIQESLRLYGPAIITSREAVGDMKVGKVVMPKGTNMWVFIHAMHRDPRIWGEDAREFKPERFEKGVLEACKHPQAYMPFGFGSRLCVGQNLAMVEAKIVLSLLISNFSFSISPNYRHCPVYKMLLMPKYGAPLLLTKL